MVDDPARPPAIDAMGVPPVPPGLLDRLQQYENVRAAAFYGWAPDGSGILIRTRFGDTYQLHRVRTPGGAREQITFFDEPVRGYFIPNAKDEAMLLTMSEGGNENEQIYLLDRAKGKTTLLTDGESRNSLHVVSEDGQRVIFSSNKRNGRDNDLYIANPRDPSSVLSFMEVENEYWYAHDISSDGKKVLLEKVVSVTESYPALLDVESGKVDMLPMPKKAGDPGETISFGSMVFANDGKTVYITTDARGEFRDLASFDLETGQYTYLAEDIAWNVDELEIHRETGRLAFEVNEGGVSGLYLKDGGHRGKFELPQGIIGSLSFSPDGKSLGFTLSRPNAPADAYSINIESGKLTRWTFSEVGGLDTEQFVDPQRIAFKSFDERMIPALMFKPREASARNKVPVLINIHGGPESQYRPYLSASDQFFVNEMGFAVIRPNVRGSTGYGKTYAKLDNAEKREDSVRDIGALLDWIEQQDDLDASRVAVRGGSYGGYMVLASLTHYPDRLRAGIDVVGIANFQTFLKNTADYRRDRRRVEYGDERDPQMVKVFERINPTANAHKIRSALLVVHGVNDPRVPFSEAKQISDIVRGNGGKVWTVFANNEGHGFGKKPNRDYQLAVEAMFLAENLKE